ncbi:MAG: exodeoxyribonuclease subunit alpha [Actinomycetota bacterium]
MTARLDSRRPLGEALGGWVAAGVLTEADAMVAASLADLAGITPDTDQSVLLALALAVRAPRSGHVAVDLAGVRDQVLAEIEQIDPDAVETAVALAWPTDPVAWLRRIEESLLCAGEGSPLVVDLGLVYLRRFHFHETRVGEGVRALAAGAAPTSGRLDVVSAALGLDGGQRAAVERCLSRRLGVLTGGPGTGKTRTVAALLAVLLDGSPDLRIALAAPTGKAAARMGESLADSVRLLAASGDAGLVDIAGRIGAVTPSTIHRLLGVRPGGAGFRHSAERRLPHQVLIIDEASMVSLPLMDAVLDALTDGARLVLVGDGGQLASVDAGSVLGDIAGAGGAVGECVAELTESRRFPSQSRIGRLAAAIRAGDGAAATAVLGEPVDDAADGVRVQLVTTVGPVAEEVGRHARLLGDAARRGDARDAVDALDELRVLCAHRRGRAGVSHWTRLAEDMITLGGHSTSGMYPGRPVIVTRNDPARGLFNGDVGVVVRTADGVRVAFAAEGEPRLIAPSHLDAVETVHAMTIHKSQGSEFDHVVVVLPSADSRLATRELLYTAVTRARRSVTLVGAADTVAAAIDRSAARTTGLVRRLS